MKSLLRGSLINALALFFLSQALSGVIITGGFSTYILAGVILSAMGYTLRPLFNLISIPLNVVTLGLFSFFSNAIILYILTVLVTDIKISSFTFQGLSWAGFVVPEIQFNTLMSYVFSAFVLSLITTFINWLIKR